jgi:hypothetical protein
LIAVYDLDGNGSIEFKDFIDFGKYLKKECKYLKHILDLKGGK